MARSSRLSATRPCWMLSTRLAARPEEVVASLRAGANGCVLKRQPLCFVTCSFWLVAVLARQGKSGEARSILERIEDGAPWGRFAEEIDPDAGAHLGNTPLLFADAEFVRAWIDLERAEA